MKMTKEEKTLVVSDEFINIYRNFNVTTQVDNMKGLSETELYLLLLLCLDRHSDDNPVVVHNLRPFKEECMLLFDLQDDLDIDNETIKNLVSLTGDKYIDTDVIRDSSGNKLPEPFTKQEIRDIKIGIIKN